MIREFKIGEVVRYGGGSTALALLQSPHAGGFHARQCMGGTVYVSSGNLCEPSEEDMQTWNRIQRDNEKRWAPRTAQTLTFERLRRVNLERCEEAFFPLRSKDGPWWGNAMAGENGEACNFVKKIDRDGSTPELVQALAYELADLVTYADLLAAYYGIDLGLAVVEKFNLVSERRNCNIKLQP